MSKYKLSKALITCTIIFSTLFICLILFSGFHHEPNKLRALVVLVFSIHLLTILIGEPVFYLLRSICVCLRSQKIEPFIEVKKDLKYDQTKKLNDQLQNLKQTYLLSGKKYKNEKLNLKYKDITRELWIFGKYFLLLLLIVVDYHEPLAYYNTNILKTLLLENRMTGKNLYDVKTIAQLYDFIDETIIEAFNGEKEYSGKLKKEPGWIKFKLAKLLGVVRLRQARYKSRKQSLHELELEERNFLPGWRLPYERRIYKNRFWRIYQPWEATPLDQNFIGSQSYAEINNYADKIGYISLLTRNVNNSRILVNFLRENNWLDDKTAAIFMDFTLYNVDANLFTVCTIIIEQTPFGSLISQLDIQSTRLLYNLDFISNWSLCILYFYILHFIKLLKHFVVKTWHAFSLTFFIYGWNLWDLCIIVLNMVIIILIYVREYNVRKLMEELEKSHKLHYVDFRAAAQMEILCCSMLGILVCLTTIRLWKVMHFAKVFRMFTATLSKAFYSLISTTLIIVIFLMGFGCCCCLINGNETERFNTIIKSVTTSLSFAFGFTSQVRPSDLDHGGRFLGLIQYIILMFIVAILLLNLFITVIIEYFVAAKLEFLLQENVTLNYLQFLLIEYNFISRWYNKLGNLFGRRRSIKKRVNSLIDFKLSQKTTTEYDMDDKIKRSKIISEILKTQLQILKRELILRDMLDM